MDWTAEQLEQVIIDRYAPWSGELRACWVVSSSGRSALAGGLAPQPVSGLHVVPLVLREDLFSAPNAVLDDLRRLLESSREAVETRTEEVSLEHTLLFVIVSLADLRVPQVSSPVILPEWLPGFGGRELPLRIEDLESSARGRTDSLPPRIETLKRCIFECDAALVNRMCQVLENSPGTVAPFWNDIRSATDNDDRMGSFFEKAIDYLSSVQNASGYRPNVKQGNTVIARIVRLVSASSPDQVAKCSERFLDALALDEDTEGMLNSSVHGLLARTSQPLPNMRRVVGSNLLYTAYAAHQFTTAAAHSGDYPLLLLSAMESTSLDLAETLSVLAQTVSLVTRSETIR